MSSFAILILFGSCVASVTPNYGPLKYAVTEPVIQVFSPRGLKVSIPHSTGIKLFAFHGNINEPFHGSVAGQLSGDITERDGEKWVYEDPTIELRVGDKIYYWIYVVKDNLGYRYEDGVYEVKEILPLAPESAVVEHIPVNSMPMDVMPLDATPTKDSPSGCHDRVFNLTVKTLDLQKLVNYFEETNLILRDLVEKHPTSAKSLMLDEAHLGGSGSENESVVQSVIRDKLNLRIKISNVVVKQRGRVQFDVPTLDDKLAIIRGAKEKLKNSKFSILY